MMHRVCLLKADTEAPEAKITVNHIMCEAAFETMKDTIILGSFHEIKNLRKIFSRMIHMCNIQGVAWQ